MYKSNPESFSGDPKIIEDLKKLKVISDTVFHMAALFPRDSFKIDYIRNGKLEAQIKRSYFSGEGQNLELAKAIALKQFVLAMDKMYGDKTWPAKF